MLGLHPTARLATTVDARTLNVAITSSPQEDGIDRLMRARPELIPRLMFVIDELDAFEAMGAEVEAGLAQGAVPPPS